MAKSVRIWKKLIAEGAMPGKQQGKDILSDSPAD
jgi:hypothetical protein